MSNRMYPIPEHAGKAGEGRPPSAGRAATVSLFCKKVVSLCFVSEIIDHLFMIKIFDLDWKVKVNIIKR